MLSSLITISIFFHFSLVLSFPFSRWLLFHNNFRNFYYFFFSLSRCCIVLVVFRLFRWWCVCFHNFSHFHVLFNNLLTMIFYLFIYFCLIMLFCLMCFMLASKFKLSIFINIVRVVLLVFPSYFSTKMCDLNLLYMRQMSFCPF